MEISEKIELRKQILIKLYNSWEVWEECLSEGKIPWLFPHINEIDLDRQIHYLEDKYYLKIVWRYIWKRYMWFHGIKITDSGVDLVENKDDFNKLFKIEINNISDVSNSNIVIGNNNSVVNNANQIDAIIELLQKSDTPKKQEIIEVAEEYKLSPTMELFWKLVGMCADAGTTAQILNLLYKALLGSS